MREVLKCTMVNLTSYAEKTNTQNTLILILLVDLYVNVCSSAHCGCVANGSVAMAAFRVLLLVQSPSLYITVYTCKYMYLD